MWLFQVPQQMKWRKKSPSSRLYSSMAITASGIPDWMSLEMHPQFELEHLPGLTEIPALCLECFYHQKPIFQRLLYYPHFPRHKKIYSTSQCLLLLPLSHYYSAGHQCRCWSYLYSLLCSPPDIAQNHPKIHQNKYGKVTTKNPKTNK